MITNDSDRYRAELLSMFTNVSCQLQVEHMQPTIWYLLLATSFSTYKCTRVPLLPRLPLLSSLPVVK